MDPITIGLLIGAGAGLLKSVAVDAPREGRDRKLQAARIRYSPFKAVPLNQIRESDPFGSALSFGATGASLGSNISAAKGQEATNAAVLKNLDAQTEYYKNVGWTPSTDQVQMLQNQEMLNRQRPNPFNLGEFTY